MLFADIPKRAFCFSKSQIYTSLISMWWSQSTISMFKSYSISSVLLFPSIPMYFGYGEKLGIMMPLEG